jgi:hypothetical protein
MPASNHFDTSSPGSAASNREQLASLVTTLAPTSTPVTAMCSRKKATASYFEWSMDKLAAPSVEGVYPGADQTSFTDKYADLARIGNYCVELRRDGAVTDWQEAVDSATGAKMAGAKVKAVKELKRDLEANLMGTQDRAAGDNAGTKPQSRGLGDWIDSAGPADIPSDYRTPSGSIHASGTFNETAMKDIIASVYRQNGEDANLTLVADTALRRVVSGFAEGTGSTNTTQRSINQNADGSLMATVSYYESDQGVVRVVNMNPACAPDTTNKDTGYFIPAGALSLYELIPLNYMPFENKGGGETFLYKWVGGLAVRHPGELGKVTVLS